MNFDHDCEKCHSKLRPVDDFGDEIDTTVPYEQYLCSECYDKIWNDLQEECCPICRTRPCEKGRDCWINPWPSIMYLCCVAERYDTQTAIDLLPPGQQTLTYFEIGGT